MKPRKTKNAVIPMKIKLLLMALMLSASSFLGHGLSAAVTPPIPVTNISANATTVAQMTPILQAPDRFRQFALARVVQGVRRVYSDNGIDDSKPSRTIAIAGGDGADRVMRDIMKTEIYFTPGVATNWVYDEVTLFDVHGRSVCDGYGQ